MLIKQTTTYTVPYNKEGQEFYKKFKAFHEWGGAQVHTRFLENGKLLEMSIHSIVDTKELIYEEEE